MRIATTTLPGASSGAASAIASRLKVIGRTGRPFCAGIDATDAAAAERVVVRVKVFALVHDAAEDDRRGPVRVLDRPDEREGLRRCDWLVRQREVGNGERFRRQPFAGAGARRGTPP